MTVSELRKALQGIPGHYEILIEDTLAKERNVDEDDYELWVFDDAENLTARIRVGMNF